MIFKRAFIFMGTEIEDLVNHLDPDVEDELRWIADGVSNEETVRRCISVSEEAWWGINELNEIVCLFGVEKYPSSSYGRCVWCLTTNKVVGSKKDFVKESKRIAREWIAKYGSLYNIIPLSYGSGLRWATLCGAKLKDIVTIHGRQAMIIEAERSEK